MKVLSVIVICFIATTFSAELGNNLQHYNGFQVFRANAVTKEQRQVLLDLQIKGKFDFWSDPSIIDTTDIMASPDEISSLKHILEKYSIDHSVMIEDVERLVAAERRSNIARLRTKQQGRIDWNAYYGYADIMEWVDGLPASYPGLVTVQSIGSSYEGRDVKLVKISNTTSTNNKTAIFMDGCFHAREWISPATVTYFINEILTKPDEYRDILNNVDFYIVPIVNPDGYEYTRTSTRMWRKTRSDHNSTSGCRGVDPNRNFDHHWGGAGTSGDKCSDIYRGPEAFSEVEARNIREFILNTKVNWQVYITVHSYGQWVLIPWSYAEEYPIDFDEMEALALKSTRALTAVYGTRYVVGQSAITLNPTAGCSDDWAKANDVKYSYTFELRDTGRYGFVLPPEFILPTAEETVAAFKEICSSFPESSH